MKLTHLLSAAVVLLASCKESNPTASTHSSEAASTDKALLENVLKTTPKGEAKSIMDVKSTAKPGDEVTLTGRIMGNEKPFVAGRAAFILSDPAVITACSDRPGDDCKTPWDTCCDTPEDRKKAAVLIQIVNEKGRVLKLPIEGVGGIANLSTLIVSGKVAENSAEDVLIINASAIQLTP